MGYLTPVLLYNDALHMLEHDPYFTRELSRACQCDGKERDIFLRSYRQTWVDKMLKLFGLYRLPKAKDWSGSSSFAQVLPAQHADTPRLIVVWGNTWEELSKYWSKDQYAACHNAKQNYINSCVTIAERELKKVKSIIKEYEDENKINKTVKKT